LRTVITFVVTTHAMGAVKLEPFHPHQSFHNNEIPQSLGLTRQTILVSLRPLIKHRDNFA